VGQSVQEAMLVYPMGGCGNTVWSIFAHLLVYWMSPKQIWSWCLVAQESSYFLSVTWKVEFRASHWLSRHFTIWTTLPPLFMVIIFEIMFCFMPRLGQTPIIPISVKDYWLEPLCLAIRIFVSLLGDFWASNIRMSISLPRRGNFNDYSLKEVFYAFSSDVNLIMWTFV
jgi:hypothetical protein